VLCVCACVHTQFSRHYCGWVLRQVRRIITSIWTRTRESVTYLTFHFDKYSVIFVVTCMERCLNSRLLRDTSIAALINWNSGTSELQQLVFLTDVSELMLGFKLQLVRVDKFSVFPSYERVCCRVCGSLSNCVCNNDIQLSWCRWYCMLNLPECVSSSVPLLILALCLAQL